MKCELELIFMTGGWGIRHIRTGEILVVDPNKSRATDLMTYFTDLTTIDFKTDSPDRLHNRIERWWGCGL